MTADAIPVGEIVRVENLNVKVRGRSGWTHLVRDLSYSVDAGGCLAIVGESGAGKSLTIRATLGLLDPRSFQVSGKVWLGGVDLSTLRPAQRNAHVTRYASLVFQDPSRSLNPTMRVGAQVTEAVRTHLELDRGAARKRAVELLTLVRLPLPEQRYNEYPHQLSGGMRQRVVIAIALACKPKLLIADEATTALDVTTQAQIMELLRDLQRELGMALIMISHDLGLAASFADEVVVMYAGRAVEQAATRELFANVRMPYTKALLEAIPRVERPPHARLPVVPGRPPDLVSLPPGCPFEPRCPNKRDLCRESDPPFTEGEPEHKWACWFPCGSEGAT